MSLKQQLKSQAQKWQNLVVTQEVNSAAAEVGYLAMQRKQNAVAVLGEPIHYSTASSTSSKVNGWSNRLILFELNAYKGRWKLFEHTPAMSNKIENTNTKHTILKKMPN